MSEETPTRVEVPAPTGVPYADELERMIIHLVSHYANAEGKDGTASLFTALGIAHSRRAYLKWLSSETGEPITEDSDGPTYISIMTARVGSLSKRQRAKLTHPQRDRAAQQRILDGEND